MSEDLENSLSFYILSNLLSAIRYFHFICFILPFSRVFFHFLHYFISLRLHAFKFIEKINDIFLRDMFIWFFVLSLEVCRCYRRHLLRELHIKIQIFTLLILLN